VESRARPRRNQNVFDVEGVVKTKAGAEQAGSRIDGEPRASCSRNERTAVHEAHGTLGTYGDDRGAAVRGRDDVPVETTDWGFSSAERNFSSTARSRMPISATDRRLFSPNGDGNLDEIELEVRASELSSRPSTCTPRSRRRPAGSR
jgi:hypothetical protein